MTRRHIGHRRRAIDWDARSIGAVRYVADIKPDQMLYGAILRAPCSRARISKLDIGAARVAPGVRAVVTSRDLTPGTRYLHEGAADRAPLSDGEVHFQGEEIAAVAAETMAQARAALVRIDIEYERLPAALSMDEALAPDAPRLHERPTGTANISARTTRIWGDMAAVRDRIVHTVSGRFHFPRQFHACMETNGTLAHWRENDGKLHLWTSTQAPYYVVLEVSKALHLDKSQVVCHEIGVGGGFGSKSKICEHEIIAALLSRESGRPVRLILTREEEFETTRTRHQFRMDMELHADADGRILAIDGKFDIDNGAYNHTGVSVMSAALKTLGQLYRPSAVQAVARLIDTATVPGGSFRGYGVTQATFAIESLVDQLAERMGLDPLNLRLRNANMPGETTLVGAVLGSARLKECLSAAAAAIGWADRAKSREMKNAPVRRGIGIASGVHSSGSYSKEGANRSDAIIDVFFDGRVRVRFGGADAGTGQRTILAQIVAEELGVALERVEVLTMDSAMTPFDMGAWSSRGTHYGGHAVSKAARIMAARLRALASSRLGDGTLRLENGAVVNQKGESLGIGEVARMSNDAGDGALSYEASYVEDRVSMPDKRTGIGNISASYNFAAHAAKVDVDCRTGHISVADYVAVHDIGIAINPISTEGQAIGGAAMGIGAALGEEVIFEQGKIVNPAYLHYALPRSGDLPRIRTVLIEGGDPNGPYGAKGVGECVVNPPAPAIANAVFDAIGIRFRELPITPDKVINALAERDGRKRVFALWRRPSRWWIAGVRALYGRGLFRILHGWTKPSPSGSLPKPVEKVETPHEVPTLLAAKERGAMVFGGGTDVHLQRRQRLAEPGRLVWTGQVSDLKKVEVSPGGGLRIGAAVTLAELQRECVGKLPILDQAIATIASTQIREMATVAGNLLQDKRCWFFRNGFGCYKRVGGLAPCYAILGDHRFYHAAMQGHRCQATTPSDLAAALMALDAEVVLHSRFGERRLKIGAFYSGPGETVLRDDEILAFVDIPADAFDRRGSFLKLRLWEGDFALVSTALSFVPEANGDWRATRLVLGGIAPVPWRASATEAFLDGARKSAVQMRTVLDGELNKNAHPLKNNGWKLDAAAGLVEQAAERLRA